MVMFVALLAVLVEADVGVGAAPSGNMGPHASGMHFVPCAAGAHRFVPPGSPHDVLLSCGTVDCATPDQLWLHRDPAATSKWRLPAAGASGPVVDAASGRCISVLDCALPSAQPQLKSAGMGVAVLDECGAGPCAGKNQQWTVAASSKPGNLHLVLFRLLL